MATILPRSAWTTASNGRAGRPFKAAGMQGIALHYPADGNVSYRNLTQAQVAAKLRAYRSHHVHGNKWADIGYNFAIDQSGRIWNTSGWNIGAHAGAQGNPYYVGILLVLGDSEEPSAAMIDAIKTFRRDHVLARYPKATAIRGHRQIPGNSTACPGKPVLKLIESGILTETKPKPKPDPPPPASGGVRFRIGTWNIPLDPEKSVGAEPVDLRLKVAAATVNDANLHILACQELDRRYQGDTWYYARLILLALREYDPTWKIVKPTTALNENITFYRSCKATLKRRLDDVILPSPAGGRHVSRSTYTIDGTTVVVRNTHLVEGKDNGRSREIQAAKIAEVSGASTIILGDLNQKEIPAALAKTHKSARLAAAATTNADYGTFASWKATEARTDDRSFLDHILVPNRATVNGYTVIGINRDGSFVLPRASDHQLAIASITFP